VLLVVDHQLGLAQLVRDFTPTEYRNNVLAHAALGNLFNLPTILTTSAETGKAPSKPNNAPPDGVMAGPNGPLPKEIIEMHPDAPYIRRNGEVNAWDNPEFKAAVEATGKKQVILAGIVTEVCTLRSCPLHGFSQSMDYPLIEATRYCVPCSVAERSWLFRLGKYRCERNLHAQPGRGRQ
jgi:nicotinamidase-related amidase